MGSIILSRDDWISGRLVCALLFIVACFYWIQDDTVKSTWMSVHQDRVSMVAIALTLSPLTAAHVHQRTSVARAPHRTASMPIRVLTAARVTAPGNAAVLLASSKPTALSTCAN